MKTLLLILTLTISGCVSMQKIMETNVGKHIDDVSSSWGAPENRMERADGGATYTWKSRRVNQYGTFNCRKTYTTDKSGIIVNYTIGKECPNFEY